jgi:hypothetical protein
MRRPFGRLLRPFPWHKPCNLEGMNIQNTLSAVLLGSTLIGAAAFAEAPDRETFLPGRRTRPLPGNRVRDENGVSISGTGCTDADTQVIRNGDAFSVIFGSLGVNLNAGQRGNEKNQSCSVHMRLDPPPGQMIVGFYQVISGGIIKSDKSVFILRASYALNGRRYTMKPFQLKKGSVVDAADPESVFSIALENTKLPSIVKCRESVKYSLLVHLFGSRSGLDQFVNSGIDSVDGEFVTNIRPVYAPCR